MNLKNLVESLFVDFLILLPTLVGFINSRPHTTEFIFTSLRLFKESQKFNHFLTVALSSPLRRFLKLSSSTDLSSSKIFSIPAKSSSMNTFFVIIKPLFNLCSHSLQEIVSKVIPNTRLVYIRRSLNTPMPPPNRAGSTTGNLHLIDPQMETSRLPWLPSAECHVN